MNATKRISVIIPTRNEENWITATVQAVIASIEHLRAQRPELRNAVEVLVVDNASTDGTAGRIEQLAAADWPVRRIHCDRLGAAIARNVGIEHAEGDILVAIDADTQIPELSLAHILGLVEQGGYEAGIFRLAGAEGGLRERVWWTFWEHVRRLPMARAKAMPAFMFCTRVAFERHGPFDEAVQIGEEWPILAGVYRADRARLIYDRTLTAISSSRRMERQPLGYTRTYLRYLWAILHISGRNGYTDRIR